MVLASSQYQTKREIPAQRGKIFSQDNFPLVLNTQAFLLYANPSQLKIRAKDLQEKLKPLVEEPLVGLDLLTEKKFFWIPLAHNLNLEVKNKIEDLNLEGLGFESSERRFYPEASMSASLLGFVGFDDKGKEKGYFGLEGYYDQEVRGKAGARFFEQDGLGRPIPLSEELEEKAIAGRSLYLNLDRSLQYISEKFLKEGLKESGASEGLVVIMNPQNGAVLAMANYPSYDPALYYRYDSNLFKNPVISSVFEPGSIFKVIAMSSALDSGAVKSDDLCSKCTAPRVIGEYTINTWNEKYYPNSTLTDIIVHSDNVGMIYVIEKLGLEKFLNYYRNFGFNDITNIDLQGEISSPVKKDHEWTEIDLATASFGQGIAVTPIQMLSAISVIANGGERYQPEVVRKISENGKEILINPVKVKRVISENTARLVTEMMEQMVEKNNTQKLKPKGYRVAGKSGTAQVPIAGHYDPKKTITSFVGFAPVDNPRFAMLVTLREPKSSQWAEATAAPIWFKIASEIFRLWKIKPNS